jgi:hypothetical protein
MINKRGQIWIETVLYTLIGLALIGLVLSFVMPRINSSKDSLVVEQSVSSLKEINNIINKIWLTPGNKWPISMSIKKGMFSIDSENDVVYFVIDGLSKPYSEVGTLVPFGEVNLLTIKNQKDYSIIASINYSSRINITNNGIDGAIKSLSPAPTPYKITLSSFGDINNDGLFVVDIS